MSGDNLLSFMILAYDCPYYSPPANGVVTCDKWNQGRICSVFCHDEFEFAAAKDEPTVYLCNANTKTWLPFNVRKPLKMPWPDCSRKFLICFHKKRNFIFNSRFTLAY